MELVGRLAALLLCVARVALATPGELAAAAEEPGLGEELGPPEEDGNPRRSDRVNIRTRCGVGW